MESEINKRLETYGKRIFKLEQNAKEEKEILISIINFLLKGIENMDDTAILANVSDKIKGLIEDFESQGDGQGSSQGS
ncbi:MAG: hypothetical protein ABIR47_04515 [Candidatus Kapaibacterium sp.]